MVVFRKSSLGGAGGKGWRTALCCAICDGWMDGILCIVLMEEKESQG